MSALVHLDFASLDYSEALRLQVLCHGAVRSGQWPGAIISLEHPPVITMGRHADPRFLQQSPEALAAQGIQVVQTSRGGEVTAHMPGQLVVYPILPLTELGLGARAYICLLQQAVVETLQVFGVQATCSAERPGVWLGNAKICAMGIRIQERVSLHGLALNVNNVLDLFSMMIPCGLADAGVTRLSEHSEPAPSVEAVKSVLLPILATKLRMSLKLHAAKPPFTSIVEVRIIGP